MTSVNIDSSYWGQDDKVKFKKGTDISYTLGGRIINRDSLMAYFVIYSSHKLSLWTLLYNIATFVSEKKKQ